MSKAVEVTFHHGCLFFSVICMQHVFTRSLFPQNGSRRDTFIKRRSTIACRAYADRHVVRQLQKDLVEESGPLPGLSRRLFHRYGFASHVERGSGYEVNCLIFLR